MDGKVFVMKETAVSGSTDHTKAEAALMQMINSDYVMRAVEIYVHNHKLYIILEYMDGNEITKIIDDFFQHYTREFKKYTLYCAAKGLEAMHKLSILHRDIKSDNIFCSSDGKIVIADLGASVSLT